MDELKKATLLLHSLIFHYHGLDDEETVLLEATASKLNGMEELKWANAFIAEDYISAFERARGFLKKTIGVLEMEERLSQLVAIWNDNYDKGYVTEMETTAMLHLAKDWEIEKEFMKEVGISEN
ncbi:MAG: hypothetical protein NXI20_04670 [bacterium]|nr:hypothetical protein [bacterium]